MHSATRYHDISCGHTVKGHEGKCRHLHGHNYRIHFTCESERLSSRGLASDLDLVGRVIDFTAIKERLCQWLEDYWDHRFLVYDRDERSSMLKSMDASVVIVNFNPTAENMARYLVEVVGPSALDGTGVQLVKVTIEETAKCSATYEVRR